MIALDPLGDRAWLARFATEDEARGWASALKRARPEGVIDVVLAYRTVGVFARDECDDPEAIETALGAIIADPAVRDEVREVRIPVLYDGEDLEAVARRLSLAVEDIIGLHCGASYRVLAVGFLPGFPYAGDLPPSLTGLPRRDSPRPRVPAGSVAIVGRQTGIYPRESPGGWHLIGRTPLSLADPETGRFPIRPGNLLRFQPIGPEEYERRLGEPLA